MKKRLVIGGVTAGVGVLALVWMVIRAPERQVYQGKTVKEWAMEYYAPGSALRGETAASALRDLGPNAVPGLIKLLGAKDSFLRRKVWALEPGLPVVVQRGIVKGVRPPGADRVRSAAARALALIGPAASGAVPALKKALEKDEYQVRFDAALALGRIGGSGLPALFGFLTNNDVNVRYAAVSALGESGPESAVVAPELLKLLGDTNDGVRVSAIGSFLKLGTNVLPFLTNTMVNGDAAERRHALRVFSTMPVPWRVAVPPLLRMFGDKDAACRLQAIQRLSAFPATDTNVIGAFSEALTDPEAEVRLAAVKALSQARARAAPALPELTRLELDSHEAVRTAAKEAVGRIEEAAGKEDREP